MSTKDAAAERINEKIHSNFNSAPSSSKFPPAAQPTTTSEFGLNSSASKASLTGKWQMQQSHHMAPFKDSAHNIAYDPASFDSDAAASKLREVLSEAIKNTSKLEKQYQELKYRGWNLEL